MTSLRQIEANRRNAGKSSGPTTQAGKRRSRCNAVRHGLTAETVIGALEDAADYKAFEEAIIADYDAESAVQRELVLRLTSLLWRLRRATTMETGLFEIQADHLREFERDRQNCSDQRRLIYSIFGYEHSTNNAATGGEADGGERNPPATSNLGEKLGGTGVALCFLRLANLPNCPLDRLSRYEATLGRQAAQIIFVLDAFDRRQNANRRRR